MDRGRLVFPPLPAAAIAAGIHAGLRAAVPQARSCTSAGQLTNPGDAAAASPPSTYCAFNASLVQPSLEAGLQLMCTRLTKLFSCAGRSDAHVHRDPAGVPLL